MMGATLPWSVDAPQDARPSSGHTEGHRLGSDWEITTSWWSMPDGTRHLIGLTNMRWIHGPWPRDLPQRCAINPTLLGKVARVFQHQNLCPDPVCGGLVGKALRVQGNLASIHSLTTTQRCCRCGAAHHPEPLREPWSAHIRLRVAEALATHGIAHTSI